MFEIRLYRFSKRPNSTGIPVYANFQYNLQCVALDDTSIIEPVVRIKASIASLANCNYARIADWNRWYFIRDMVLETGGTVLLYLSVDVLASYRTAILASTQYVLRADSQYDGTIVDQFYPTKVDTEFDNAFLSVTYNGNDYDCAELVSNQYLSDYFTRLITQGEFVIGVIGENATGISYYSLNYTNFKNLLANLMAFTPSNMSDVSSGIAKVLADPMQYITTCFWVPYAGQVSQTARSIKFGYYSISCTAGLLNADDYCHFMTYCDVPKHPQANSRGLYLNTAPFTSLTLYFNPFGEIQLDTIALATAEKLRIEWYYDCTKGNAELFVYNNNTGEIAYHGYEDKLGVSIQLTQLTVNSLQTGQSILDTIGNIFKGNIGGIFGSIGNAVESQQPKVSKSGSEGSFLNYRSLRPMFRAQFNKIVDEDRVNVGRPLCQRVQLDTLSGYIQCGNASIAIDNALQRENDMIVNYLNDGIFVEGIL